MTTYIIRDITYSGRRTVEGSLADIISYYWPNGISVPIETIDELVRAVNASFAVGVPGRRFERAVRASARHTIASEANRERAEKAERRRIEAERREAEAVPEEVTNTAEIQSTIQQEYSISVSGQTVQAMYDSTYSDEQGPWFVEDTGGMVHEYAIINDKIIFIQPQKG